MSVFSSQQNLTAAGIFSSDQTTLPNLSSLSTRPPLSRNEQLVMVELAVMAVVGLLALVGNCLVFMALWLLGVRKLSNMNYMLLHLCIADLSVVALNVVPQLAWKVTFHFKGGLVLCKAVTYLQVSVWWVW